MIQARYLGRWWPRGKGDQALHGVLEIASDQIQLELLGIFGNAPLFRFEGQEDDFDYIEGVTSDNKYIVLEGCLYRGGSETLPTTPQITPTFPLSRYSISGVYVTENSRGVEDLSLHAHKVYVSFTYLPHWLRGRGIRTESEVKDDGGFARHTATIEQTSFPEANLGQVTLSFRQGFSSEGDSVNRYEIKPLYWAIFESPESMALERWVQDYIGPFGNFLTLATNEVSEILGISLWHNDNQRPLTPPIGSRKYDEIHFEYTNSRIYGRREREAKPFLHWEAPLPLGDVRERFSEVITTWYQVQNDVPAVLSLVASVESTPNLYVETQFLNLARAAEVLHRVRGRNSVLPAEDYTAKKERILDALGEEDRVWLKGRLGHANEPSLKMRVGELFNSVPDLTSRYPCNAEAFAQLVAKNRNSLNHYTTKTSKWILDSVEIYWLSRALLYLLKALLLQSLGESADRLTKPQEFGRMIGNLQKITHTRKL